MKKFIILLILFSSLMNAQQTYPSYEKLWKEVENQELENLPKSANEIVEKIYQLAKKDQNSPQLVKAILYQSKFALILEEDSELTIIHRIEKEISESSFPTQNILESILANLYWQYFQQNRWKFYNRTETAEKVDPTDFRTWDLMTLFKEIHIHFERSLDEEMSLQKTNLQPFERILIEGYESKKYRPTLFDFLAHQALDFYKTGETHLTKPAYKFELADPKYLSPVVEFSQINLESKDTLSLQFNALKLFQKLSLFHSMDVDPSALIILDSERLNFVKLHAIFPKIEDVFQQTLIDSKNKFIHHESGSLYDALLAQLYFIQGSRYTGKTDVENQWHLKKALETCQEAINRFPESLGADNCIVLKDNILQINIEMTTEEYISVNKPSRILVQYKNVDQLHFKALKISEIQLKSLHEIYNDSEKLAKLNLLKVQTSWSDKLVNVGDYQNHSIEVKIPALEQGFYVIMASPHATFDKEYAIAFVQATDLALVEIQSQNEHKMQIVNRTDGKPIPKANVHLKTEGYNRYGKTFDKKFVTDNNGMISLPNDGYYYGLKAKVKADKKYGLFGNYYIHEKNNYSRSRNDYYQVFLFTDRSIYRPSQKVYFKAIVIERKKEEKKLFSNVVPNEKVLVTLHDVNYQEVGKLELETNGFGSVSGEFTLPENGLTGQFSIRLHSKEKLIDGTTYISVEEYKRPKFETTFKAINETFKVNDTVKVTGTALAYAGSNITDAEVTYSVHRKVQYPHWWYWRMPYYQSEPQEITHGKTTTNEKGEYEISFLAMPDNSVDKKSFPIFQYEVKADVTDINGETHSATTIVQVGYHAITAGIFTADKWKTTDALQKIKISTKNLNGENVAATGSLKIYKLQAPKQVKRPRPWVAPEFQMWTEEAFNQLFPHDTYLNEDDANNWLNGKMVFSTPFENKIQPNVADTETEIQLKNEFSDWESGKYQIVLSTKDRFGTEITEKFNFELSNPKELKVADAQLLQVTKDKNKYLPGETVVLKIGSASPNANVMVFVERNNRIVKIIPVSLKNEVKTVEIPTTISDLGGFAISFHLVNFNSFQSNGLDINVENPEEKLEIETVSFRDKIEPGSLQTWSFILKGNEKERKTAEVLAGMYDASLDQFRPHTWQKPTLPTVENYYGGININANSSFRNTQFHKHLFNYEYMEYEQIYDFDQLNWFGFSLNFNRWQYMNYLKSISVRNLENEFSGSERMGEGDEFTISGVVSDEDGPLPGVTVIIKGTKIGAETDFDGKFSLNVKKGDLLQFSYVGMISEYVKVNDSKLINVSMSGDNQVLEEVVVTAYGVERKSEKTASAVVAMEEQVAGLSMNNSDKLEEVVVTETQAKVNTDFSDVKVRTNFNETAFFFPHLKTDAQGNVSFTFTSPEALTRWKIQLLGHTQDMKTAYKFLTTLTQKDLMVLPNAPRFLREGDEIIFSTKISNLTENAMNGMAMLELTDAVSGKNIDVKLANFNATQGFQIDAKGNTSVSWTLKIPFDIQAVQYKIVAKSGNFSDGEQNVLPVLSNRMLVTETLPMWINSNETKTFTLNKLKNNTSSTLQNHKLTLEVTSNPVWYAIQALPYLMEYPYDCSEQIFSRFYANALATKIVNDNPKIKTIFDQWKDTDALLSNLEKNEELKSLVISETPWLRDAQSESEQKKRIALLFDLKKMTKDLEKAANKLYDMQMSDGGFPWFKGSPYPSRYITQHIAAGFGHLEKMDVFTLTSKLNLTFNESEKTHKMLSKAIQFLDKEILKDYNELLKSAQIIREKAKTKAEGEKLAKEFLASNHLGAMQLHYLYTRTFYSEITLDNDVKTAVGYYTNQAYQYWKVYGLYQKGLIALVAQRNVNTKIAQAIVKSLDENSITHAEMGMYWKENKASWYWYQAPIETQAMMIEVFAEVKPVQAQLDQLNVWLLKNKQTNRWETTKSTTEAIYALLAFGTDWTKTDALVEAKVGYEDVTPSQNDAEAGSGYYKKSWNTNEVKPDQAVVTLTKKDRGIAWGGLYWQYFENLDKITFAETPLKISKKLFLKQNTDTGEKLFEIKDNSQVKLGDLVRVRIELKVDRDMEYVHMKDMRASGFEPVNVLSEYKYQDNLGYYESTKDAATNFFFDYLRKGVYVFEYDLRANNAGDFSNGITTIQCMYAPEFTSHSEGVRVKIEK